MTESDYRFMLRQPRPDAGGVGGAVSEVRQAVGDVPELETRHRVRRHAHTSQNSKIWSPVRSPDPATARTTRDDIAFWLYTSGSTGKPKGAVHVHADLKLTDDLYGGPYLGIAENDVCYSVAKLFFAYGLGNAMTFPMSAGATTVLCPTARRPTRRSAFEAHPVTVFYGFRPSTRRFWRARPRPIGEVKFRFCVSAGEALPRGRRPAFARTIQLRHPRRHRFDGDAAHLPEQPRR